MRQVGTKKPPNSDFQIAEQYDLIATIIFVLLLFIPQIQVSFFTLFYSLPSKFN